jgi:hypothetical protein
MKERFGLKRSGMFPSPLARFKNGKWQHVEFVQPVDPTSRGK